MGTKEKLFEICDCEVLPGQTKHLNLKLSESFMSEPIQIPFTVINGVEPGPRVFVFAAIHGDEINGVDIVRRLIYEVSHESLRGTLIAVPVVNVQGFQAQSRYLPGHHDLNRYFPGCVSGNNAQQVAYNLFKKVVLNCDFGIDLHTAGEGRLNLPHVRGDMSDRRVRALAKATGAPILVHNPGLEGTLRKEATDKGVPTILFEAGEPRRFDPKVSKAGLAGLLNLLCKMKMRPKEPGSNIPFSPPFQVVVKRRKWIRAQHGGILELNVSPGDLVYEGDVIATILNPFGKLRKKIRTNITGIVLGTSVQPLATPGTGVAHVAEIKRGLPKIENILREREGNRSKAA